MSLETNSNEAFLGGNNGGGEDLAALDSMSFTNQSQYGMNTVNLTAQPQQQQPPPNMNNNHPAGAGAGGSAVADGSSGGFAGVSGSLFDRIKARAEEQQNAPAPSQQQQQQQQTAAQSSSQQSAFMSQQPPPQGGGEATMEIERNTSDPYNSSTSPFGNVGGQGTPTSQPAQNNNNETTYSFSASGGEDFSQTATSQPPGAGLLRIPQYDQVNYASSDNNQQQQYNQHSSLQEHAQNAMQQTGPILKSLWDAGVNGAQSVGAMAQSKISGSNANNSGGAAVAGGRQYNNNFLLREDSMGGGGPHVQHPPPPLSAADLDPEAAAGSVGAQGYSMLQYGKTFCEDVTAFIMQLPPVGKGAIGVVLLWILYVLFG